MELDLQDVLVPYILTFSRNASRLNTDLDLHDDIVVLQIEDEANTEFCRLQTYANQLTFGGIKSRSVPAWVSLDCAIMPTAVTGFMLSADDTPDELWDLLEIDDDYDGWVPVSQYCAALTVEPGCVSGFSLHSYISNQGIATRTKALALAVLDAKAQVGVAQFHDPTIRVHTRFGPIEVLVHRPIIHAHTDDTFLYRLLLPELRVLEQMAREVVEFGDRRRPEGIPWTFDPSDERAHVRLRTHLSSGGRAWIVSPGWRGTSEGCEIDMILGE